MTGRGRGVHGGADAPEPVDGRVDEAILAGHGAVVEGADRHGDVLSVGGAVQSKSRPSSSEGLHHRDSAGGTSAVAELRIPGLLDALEPLLSAVRRIGDALLGYRVIPADLVEVGHPVRSGSDLVAHPLDVIALKYSKDPHARLDAAIAWILADAEAKFDAAVDLCPIHARERS